MNESQPMIRALRQAARRAVMFLGLLPAFALRAEGAGLSLFVPAQAGGGNVQPISPGPGSVVETLIVLVLVGAVLFAVCRSSRRL